MDKEEGVGGEGSLLALGSTGFLTQETDLGGTTFVDACNGFNELIRLKMMWICAASMDGRGEVCVQLI